MPEDPADIGRRLGIPACKGCREPLGGRYGPRRLCWDCYVKAHPGAGKTPRRRDQRTPFQRLVDHVWRALAAQGATVHYLSRDHVGARCPICELGTISVRFVNADPPRVRIEGDGCTAGCDARDVARRIA